MHLQFQIILNLSPFYKVLISFFRSLFQKASIERLIYKSYNQVLLVLCNSSIFSIASHCSTEHTNTHTHARTLNHTHHGLLTLQNTLAGANRLSVPPLSKIALGRTAARTDRSVAALGSTPHPSECHDGPPVHVRCCHNLHRDIAPIRIVGASLPAVLSADYRRHTNVHTSTRWNRNEQFKDSLQESCLRWDSVSTFSVKLESFLQWNYAGIYTLKWSLATGERSII